MRYAKIDRRIWTDEKFRRLSPMPPSGQGLFVYLLTNPYVGVIPGCYSAGEQMLAEALAWDIEGFRERFAELLREGLIEADLKARLIWVPKAIFHNLPDNPNIVRSWGVVWDELPECDLKRKAWGALRDALQMRGEQWVRAFLETCPNGSSNALAYSSGNGSPNGSPKGMANQELYQEQDIEQEKTIYGTTPVEAKPGESPVKNGGIGLARIVLETLELGTDRWTMVAVGDAIDRISKQPDYTQEKACQFLIDAYRAWKQSPKGSASQMAARTWFNDSRYNDKPKSKPITKSLSDKLGKRRSPDIRTQGD